MSLRHYGTSKDNRFSIVPWCLALNTLSAREVRLPGLIPGGRRPRECPGPLVFKKGEQWIMGKIMLPKGFNPQVTRRWYLVANRTEALIYEGPLNGSFHYVKRLKNKKGKLREGEFSSDRIGRVFASSRSGIRHGLEPRTLRHEIVAADFAKKIAMVIDKAVLREECSDLVVLAEPRFLGLINKELSSRVKAVLRSELPKEWKRGSDEELVEYLRTRLA